jgi:Zn-dependent peptidase ImmA (M78 family)
MFILTSCSGEKTHKTGEATLMVTQELEPYLDDWISECKKRNIDHSNILNLHSIYTNDNLDEYTHAITYFDTHEIEIKTNGQTEWQKRFLMYHELGHYVFGLEHSRYDDVIMTWDMKYENWYSMNWEEMKDEYFETVSDKYHKD